MRTGFIIGILWTIGILLSGKLNNIITDGQYASGIGIFFTGIFVLLAIGILSTNWDDAYVSGDEQ